MRVHRYTMSKQSGCIVLPASMERDMEPPPEEFKVPVHRYTMNKQTGNRMRRVCAGSPVHYEQTVRLYCPACEHGARHGAAAGREQV